MIKYKFGNIECKISFKDFFYIIYKDNKIYKSQFNDFPEFFEFIDKNIINISYLLFDGYEYYLENGLLHNLYGPAMIKHIDDESSYFKGTVLYFFIDGKKVYNNLNDRGCKNIEDFQNKKIFHYEEISYNFGKDENGKYYRRKEGIDYKIIKINLKNRILNDQRNKKLKIINDNR